MVSWTSREDILEDCGVREKKSLTLSYTPIIVIASFTAMAENGQCKNNGI